MAGQALQITPGRVKKTLEHASRLMARAKGAAKKTEQVMEQAVHSLEVSGAAFGMGVLAGKAGKVPEFMGVPIDLALGTACHVAGFTGLGGKASSHFHGLGDGMLAHFAAMQGLAVGDAWQKKQSGGTAPPKAAAAGEGISDAEARRYAQNA